MSLPAVTLRTLDLHFRAIPDDLSDADRHRLMALTAINYLGSLGRLTSFLSTMRIASGEGFEYIKPTDQLEELDHALFVLGELQTGLADTAYMAVEEMFTALLTPPGAGVESETK